MQRGRVFSDGSHSISLLTPQQPSTWLQRPQQPCRDRPVPCSLRAQGHTLSWILLPQVPLLMISTFQTAGNSGGGRGGAAGQGVERQREGPRRTKYLPEHYDELFTLGANFKKKKKTSTVGSSHSGKLVHLVPWLSYNSLLYWGTELCIVCNPGDSAFGGRLTSIAYGTSRL